MSQKFQTKLNDSAHICVRNGLYLEPCGYHQDRVNCTLEKIEHDLIEAPKGALNGLLSPNKHAIQLASWFVRDNLPAGSWYLVKEQREWLKASFIKCFETKNSEQKIKLMIAGIASYVHAVGQLLIIIEALKEANCSCPVEVTIIDRCDFPLEQTLALLEAAESLQRFRRLKFSVGSTTIKCTKKLDKEIRENRNALEQLDIKTIQGDLADSKLVDAETFDIVTEHFLTSLLYKDPIRIQPIRSNFSFWLKPGGLLLSADGLRMDSESYSAFLQLNEKVGLTATSQMPVWDPYGLHQEIFQDLVDKRHDRPIPIDLDNTLTEFVKG